ncbi:MAG: leucine-rich repeat domain-containing protein [Prevotella sp.]
MIVKRRYTTLSLTLLLSVLFATSALAYDVEVDGIYYNLVKDDYTAEVTGTSFSTGDVIIPNTIVFEDREFIVTSIGNNAFEWKKITSVKIPNSVTSIGNYAFGYCESFTSVTLPDYLTSIGAGAFCACRNLPDITIPNTVISIGSAAFRDCHSFTSFTIPNSVTSIEDDTFCWCYTFRPSIGNLHIHGNRAMERMWFIWYS